MDDFTFENKCLGNVGFFPHLSIVQGAILKNHKQLFSPLPDNQILSENKNKINCKLII